MHYINKPIKIAYTDFWGGFTGDFFMYDILKKYFPLEIAPDPDILIFSVYGKKHLNYDCHKIQYIGENQRPRFWYSDFACSFDYTNDERHLRLPNYVSWFTPEYSIERLLQKKTDEELETLRNNKKKFCCFVVSGNYGKERNEFFEKLSAYKKVDSGGALFNNIGYKVVDKLDFVKDYKFIIAFENASYPGYTTEKILHAKQVDTIPIYWGNPIVDKEMNTKSFLNYHDYNSFDKLMEKVIEVDNSDALYSQYLKEPLFYNGQPNEYCGEERIVTFFENVLRSLNKPSVSKSFYFKAKLKAARLLSRT